jgi:hypothetical protein
MRQNQRRGSGHRGVIVLLLFAALMVVALPAMAAKGGGTHGGGGGKNGGATGGGTISLAPLVTDANGDGLPNWGDVVEFNISTTATTEPWVYLKCMQGGTMVAQGWGGYFDGSLGGRTFGLSSPAWAGGAADCTANLQTPTGSVLASTSFHVYA